MFLQHWATCSCRRPSVGQTISVAGVSSHVLAIRHQLAAIALISPSKTWEYVVKSAIRPENISSSLSFGALKLFFDIFVFLVKIGRLNSFILIKFSKLTKLKMSHPKEQL